MTPACRLGCLLACWLAPAWAGGPFRAWEEGAHVLLSNGEHLRAAIAPADGGELAGLSLKHADGWRQLLYRGAGHDPAPGWRGRAPLLWPATGISSPEGEQAGHYRLDGRVLAMPIHGFARNRAWRVVALSGDENAARASLVLSDDEASRELYPFGFDLRVDYRLLASGLQIGYAVTAAQDNHRAMPFSIGNHITFRAPLLGEHDPGSVQFENQLPLQLLRRPDKTFAGRTRPSPWRGRHRLSELPRRDAVSLGGAPDSAALDVIDPSGLVLHLSHRASGPPRPPAVLFNLWADAQDGFFSPEPWQGTQNSLNTGWGLVYLEPGQTWTWEIEIGLDQVDDTARNTGESES